VQNGYGTVVLNGKGQWCIMGMGQWCRMGMGPVSGLELLIRMRTDRALATARTAASPDNSQCSIR